MKHDEVKIEADKFRVILHYEKNERGSRTIDVCTKRNGSLTVGGYDVGPSVEELLGNEDYEFDATVAAEDKTGLYATLKKELFDGHEEFRSWLADEGVVDVEADFNVVLLLMLKKLGLYPHGFASWAREHDIDVSFWSYP